jgi:hypothetical protein
MNQPLNRQECPPQKRVAVLLVNPPMPRPLDHHFPCQPHNQQDSLPHSRVPLPVENPLEDQLNNLSRFQPLNPVLNQQDSLLPDHRIVLPLVRRQFRVELRQLSLPGNRVPVRQTTRLVSQRVFLRPVPSRYYLTIELFLFSHRITIIGSSNLLCCYLGHFKVL